MKQILCKQYFRFARVKYLKHSCIPDKTKLPQGHQSKNKDLKCYKLHYTFALVLYSQRMTVLFINMFL